VRFCCADSLGGAELHRGLRDCRDLPKRILNTGASSRAMRVRIEDFLRGRESSRTWADLGMAALASGELLRDVCEAAGGRCADFIEPAPDTHDRRVRASIERCNHRQQRMCQGRNMRPNEPVRDVDPARAPPRG
jgi:hypothetical protein